MFVQTPIRFLTKEVKMNINNTQNTGVSVLKILVFGESGVGKTTLAGTINEPTLIISAEAGLLSLGNKKIDVIDLSLDDNGNVIPKEKRIARLGEVYQYLTSDACRKKYKWIFIDSLTEINQNLLEQLNLEFPERKDSLPMYGELAKRMRSLVKTFRDLPYYNVVFTALSETDKDENGQRFIGISLVGSFSTKIAAFFDEVLYLHADRDADGNTKRILVTEKSDKLMAKDRSGKLNKFEEPNLALIASKINQQPKKENVKNV